MTDRARCLSDDLPDDWQRLVFATALVVRMQPNYQLFYELTGAGDAAIFNNIVNLVWEYLAGHNAQVDFGKQQDKLEAITPDPDQFDMYGVWPALDSCVALTSLLSACGRFNLDELRSIEHVTVYTIDAYLDAMQITEGEHPLHIDNKQFQQQLQDLLLNSGSSREAVKAAKTLLDSIPVSNIGLEV